MTQRPAHPPQATPRHRAPSPGPADRHQNANAKTRRKPSFLGLNASRRWVSQSGSFLSFFLRRWSAVANCLAALALATCCLVACSQPLWILQSLDLIEPDRVPFIAATDPLMLAARAVALGLAILALAVPAVLIVLPAYIQWRRIAAQEFAASAELDLPVFRPVVVSTQQTEDSLPAAKAKPHDIIDVTLSPVRRLIAAPRPDAHPSLSADTTTSQRVNAFLVIPISEPVASEILTNTSDTIDVEIIHDHSPIAINVVERAPQPQTADQAEPDQAIPIAAPRSLAPDAACELTPITIGAIFRRIPSSSDDPEQPELPPFPQLNYSWLQLCGYRIPKESAAVT